MFVILGMSYLRRRVFEVRAEQKIGRCLVDLLRAERRLEALDTLHKQEAPDFSRSHH